jgi:D-alanyl-D-alanine carboxypeptidase
MFRITLFITAALIFSLTACEEPEDVRPNYYDCEFFVKDTSDLHPKAQDYQRILEENRQDNIVGAVLLVRDRNGLWMGADGLADIHNGIEVQTCNRFLIASITKVFTAATIMSLVEDDRLSLDDQLNKWIDNEITDQIANANQATIRMLLDHTSGIPDYYTAVYELDRINTVYDRLTYEETLEYVYGKKETHPVGETYYYSNTNYLLLGMVIEEVTKLDLEKVYKDRIFDVLNLESAYYSDRDPIPRATVKGYADIYGTGQFVESEFLYKEELVTADGGIAINAYDLSQFIEWLYGGRIVSQETLNLMMDWFELPDDWKDDEYYYHQKNGLGLEYYETPYGDAIGHTGGIDGFSTIMYYFPEKDMTFVYFQNSVSLSSGQKEILDQTLEMMFKD